MQNDYGFPGSAKRKHRTRLQRRKLANLAELGWLGVFSEADGGFGGGAIETALMSEQFGRGLLIEPFLATVILAGGAIKHGGSEEQKSQYLPGIIEV